MQHSQELSGAFLLASVDLWSVEFHRNFLLSADLWKFLHTVQFVDLLNSLFHKPSLLNLKPPKLNAADPSRLMTILKGRKYLIFLP
jgi:hypothetical protein